MTFFETLTAAINDFAEWGLGLISSLRGFTDLAQQDDLSEVGKHAAAIAIARRVVRESLVTDPDDPFVLVSVALLRLEDFGGAEKPRAAA